MDISEFQKAEKNQYYIAGMRPVINKEALFSDTTEDYVYPPEPSAYGEVTIRFRSARNNIDRVFFVCIDDFVHCSGNKRALWLCKGYRC